MSLASRGGHGFLASQSERGGLLLTRIFSREVKIVTGNLVLDQQWGLWWVPRSEAFRQPKTGSRHTTRAGMENPMLASKHNSIERSETHDIRTRTIRNSRRSRSAPEDHAPSGARNDSPGAYPRTSAGRRRASEGVAVQDQRSGSRHSFGCSQARFTR